MIQRIQSVWLLLAAVFDAVTFRFPFLRGDWLKDQLPNTVVDLNAKTTIWISVLSVLAGLLAIVSIFLYNNRKQQLRLAYLGTGFTVGLLAVYFLEMSNFNNGTLALWCLFYFAILLFYRRIILTHS